MKRLFVVPLSAAILLCSAGPSQTENWQMPGFGHSLGSLHGNPSSQAARHFWPRVNHEPAITKTMMPASPVVEAPSENYVSEWQHQAPLSRTPLPSPQFSYPQQGYYPREGEIPQVPGYEYDFGNGSSYPPAFPMEGASWSDARRSAAPAKFGAHVPQPFPARHPREETHIGCLHW